MARPRNIPETVKDKTVPLERPEYQDTLLKIRAMWEFCAVVQFCSFFKQLLKLPSLDDVDVDELEEDLLGLNSALAGDNGEKTLLERIESGLIGLAINVKSRTNDVDNDVQTIFRVSCNKGGIYSGLDEVLEPYFEGEGYFAARRYKRKYSELDTIDKVRVLGMLVRIISVDDKFRDKMAESNSNIEEFRVLPVGWQTEFGMYYLFDDNRLYFKQEFEPDLSDVKKRIKQNKGSRKKRVIESPEEENGIVQVTLGEALAREYEPEWKCLCWDLSSWKKFMSTLKVKKSKIEKDLYSYLNKQIMPIIEQNHELRQRNSISRERNREKVVLVANRKRSSRLEEKQLRLQQEAEERKVREEEEKQLLKIRQVKQEQVEKEQARERRFLERQSREEERKKRNDSEDLETFRRSLRNRTSTNEDHWVFDCTCGVHGDNYDDGSLTVSCERCNIWMHVHCLPIDQQNQILQERARVQEQLKQLERSQLVQGRSEQDNSNEESSMIDNEFICERCKRLDSMKIEEQKQQMESKPIEEQNQIEQQTQQLESKPIEEQNQIENDNVMNHNDQDKQANENHLAIIDIANGSDDRKISATNDTNIANGGTLY